MTATMTFWRNGSQHSKWDGKYNQRSLIKTDGDKTHLAQTQNTQPTSLFPFESLFNYCEWQDPLHDSTAVLTLPSCKRESKTTTRAHTHSHSHPSDKGLVVDKLQKRGRKLISMIYHSLLTSRLTVKHLLFVGKWHSFISSGRVERRL